jgi:glycosyltransferase involved in cell wall biosynthesis
MPVYVDVSAAVHGRAGLGRYAQSLTRAMVETGGEDFVLFYNLGPHEEKCSLPGLEQLPARRISAGYKPWRMAVWIGHLAGIGFDTLFPGAHLFHATEHLLPPLHTTPSVFTVHDLIFHLFPQHHKRLNLWYLNATMPLFCRRADAIIAVSQSTKNDIVRHYGVDGRKITVIYEAAAPHFTPQAPEWVEKVRQKYNLPDRYVLRVGTLEPRKNLIRVLEALHHLRQRGDVLPLVLVGSKGWLYEGFFRRLTELHMEDQVILPGYIPDEDLPAVMSGAAMLIEASLYEGFGLPVLEAMASGTPVVCSSAGSLPEIGGNAARYFSPGQVGEMAAQISVVWKDVDLQQAMREAGIARAAQFSWTRAAAETLTVYQRVTG